MRRKNTLKRSSKRGEIMKRGSKRSEIMKRSSKRVVKKHNPYIEYDLFNGDKWDNYRLGDVIFGYFACWDNVCSGTNNPNVEHTCENVDFDVDQEWCQGYLDVWTDPKDSSSSYIKNIHKNFPESIASKYVDAVGYPNTYKSEDHKTIKKIFRDFNYKKPSPSALVIHLRLGDTLAKEYAQEYSYDMKYYEKLLRKVRKNKKIKKIDIVTGLPSATPVPDPLDSKDFYYMSHSKYFANSGGGFSLLITNYLKHSKTNIIYENK